jgi:hypothetical protein
MKTGVDDWFVGFAEGGHRPQVAIVSLVMVILSGCMVRQKDPQILH